MILYDKQIVGIRRGGFNKILKHLPVKYEFDGCRYTPGRYYSKSCMMKLLFGLCYWSKDAEKYTFLVTQTHKSEAVETVFGITPATSDTISLPEYFLKYLIIRDL